MSELRTFDQITSGDAETVGGKGLSLGLLASAGLPVPPGFCITTTAHRRLRGRAPTEDGELSDRIATAYRELGAGLVAVRSSATAEDGAAASFAGQQETILGVQGESAVLDAVGRCWASLDSERAVAYRRKQGVAGETLAMAVVVQRLVPSEVSGVLFTRDPLDAEGRRMLVEASWGLGEAVVSGRVTPDRFHLDRATGAVLDRHVSSKRTMVTAAGACGVPAEMQDRPCLSDAQLAELAELGRRVEAYYGDARDVEWAWAEGRFWLLQARPITTAGAAEREQVRREEIESLQKRAAPGGTVWARYNLAEVLAAPTPMTWAIVRRFMSGKGGFGLMYRDLGFTPDPSLDDDGIFDLVCGRPYCNLSREPLLQFPELPLGYSFAALKAEPHKALYPQQPTYDSGRAGWRFWMFLPIVVGKSIVRTTRRLGILQQSTRTFAEHFRKEVLPPFLADVACERETDLTALDSPALVQRLEQWVRRTLYEFARDSLKPTVLAAVAMDALQRGLTATAGPEAGAAQAGELILGVHPDPDADVAAGVQELAAGRLDRTTFLDRFGHRGSHEMELSQPRWSEDAAAVDRLAKSAERSAPAAAQHEKPKLSPALEESLQAARTYLGLRETAKHHLLRGYALIRRILLELDRRHRLQGGILYLTPDELPRLLAGDDLSELINQRRRRRSLLLSLEVPPVLFSDDLEAIGRVVQPAGADALRGVPLSAGVAEGPALVLEEPTTEVPAHPYVLVCPSTDPSWVPLFAHARALVMETGGVLSHGAIVAREFGLPAVAGLPDVQRRLRSGQWLRVDGTTGTVTLLPDSRS